ncbi:MAG TPA: N-acetylglucosamine-6-phosphate deacetylase [Natronosporangium sp.]|nr:N-acetylglucosamine-6-phosphate deacetylase [Natronosporangium sp.]
MILRGRVVTPEEVRPGEVQVAGDRIVSVTLGHGDAGNHLILPGFVDIHSHGGGGYSFTAADPAAARAAAEFHLRHGTTTILASLVSAPAEELRAAVTALAPLVSEGVLAGVHLEGPYLSPSRRGAHDPAYLRDPSLAELADLLRRGGGAVRVVTLAPERPGGLEAVRWLAAQGVVVAIGHTDATYEQTRAAVAAGATVATHLGNAMGPVHHRAPGPVVALLAAPEVTCELIADGAHLHDGMLAFAARTAGPGRTALVTDATAAAGMPDGTYHLGGRPVTVSGGVVRLAGPDGSPAAAGAPLAGSTLTMDAALRRAIRAGLSIVEAARAAATTPARAIGLGGTLGAIAPGLRADLVVLDPDLRVVRVVRAGTTVAGRG